jgi:NAD dependent epimerase/dehydratase family enzyme
MIGLVMGELGKSFLNSQRVNPEKLAASGFSFRYPDIHGALGDIIG